MPLTLRNALASASPSTVIAAAAGLIIVIALSIGLTTYLHNRAWEKREAEAAAEREAIRAEKDQLQAERDQLRGRVEEQEAVSDATKKVVATTRRDRSETIKELQQIEADYERRKKELEAAGSTLSDADLRRELCRRLRERGYPPCPD